MVLVYDYVVFPNVFSTMELPMQILLYFKWSRIELLCKCLEVKQVPRGCGWEHDL